MLSIVLTGADNPHPKDPLQRLGRALKVGPLGPRGLQLVCLDPAEKPPKLGEGVLYVRSSAHPITASRPSGR